MSSDYARFLIADRVSRPGRIHHCMRSIGIAQRALDTMIQRVTDPSRKTFGKYLYQHGCLSPTTLQHESHPVSGTVLSDIAKSRADIEGARLLVLSAALQIDKHQAKGALKEIGIAKVWRFRWETVQDEPIQVF